MRIETGDGEWVGIAPTMSNGYYEITFGINDNDVDCVAVVSLDELRQIVAAIEGMERPVLDLVWLHDKDGDWHLGEEGCLWSNAPYTAWCSGYVDAYQHFGAVESKSAECESQSVGVITIARWATEDGHRVPPFPGDVSDGDFGG